MPNLNALPAVLVAGLTLGGCSMGGSGETVHRMGEITAVGGVIYNVFETEWRNQLGTSLGAKIPDNKYLVIRLTVTNSGNRQASLPLLTLVDADGKEHLEISEVKGLNDWLGLLRILDPASTIQGTIVFDVPPGDYKLRVSDGGDLEHERTALVEIPLSLNTAAPVAPAVAPGSGN